MESFLQSDDSIDVVYAHNDDMGLGAIEAIEAAGLKPGEDIKIITVDAVHDGMHGACPRARSTSSSSAARSSARS